MKKWIQTGKRRIACVWIIFVFTLHAPIAQSGPTSGPETFSGPPPAVLLPDAIRHPEISLWPNGAPGSEGKRGEERYRIVDERLVLSSIHDPSITVYLPPEKIAAGAAVLVIPGGGFRSNWITHEGYRVADWLAQRGIAAFVLKYRLERDAGSEYTMMEHSLADAQRALRTIRGRADEWNVDPERVGVMGFSAGGVLSGLVGVHFDQAVKTRVDEIDDLDAKPAFVGLVYGSPFDPSRPSHVEIRADMPPVFMIAGGDDRIAEAYPAIYQRLKRAGVSAELHIYAGVGHGFGIQGKNPPAVAGWPDRFYEWLFAQGML